MKTPDEAMREAGGVFTDTFWSDPRNNPLPTIPIIRDMERDAMAAALRALDEMGYELRAKAPLCAPSDSQRVRWMVTFDDAERGYMIFTDEDEARKAFDRASEGWNCYLWTLAAAPRLAGGGDER